MKNILSKINKEKVFNFIIVLIIILLYIFVFMFVYANFRERKRQEISNELIKKVDEEIKQNNNSNEFNTQYDGVKYTILGKLRIKKINIYQPILKENTKKSYDSSVVKVAGPNLNTFGNVTIGGHNFMRGNFFIKINRLVKNDVVTVTDLSGNSVNYYVYEYGITTIDDASYLAQPSNPKEMMVTLVTCTKGGKQRYYVKARAK